MEPEDVPQNHPRAPGVYRDRAGWRTLINCVLNIPGIGSAQRHVIKRWPFDTPLEEMQQWRLDAKPRIEAELQQQLDATFQELAKLKANRAREPKVPKDPATSYATVRDQLSDAERQIAAQAETIRRLQQAVSQAERRAAMAEQSAREVGSRAYRFATMAAGARR